MELVCMNNIYEIQEEEEEEEEILQIMK